MSLRLGNPEMVPQSHLQKKKKSTMPRTIIFFFQKLTVYPIYSGILNTRNLTHRETYLSLICGSQEVVQDTIREQYFELLIQSSFIKKNHSYLNTEILGHGAKCSYNVWEVHCLSIWNFYRIRRKFCSKQEFEALSVTMDIHNWGHWDSNRGKGY